MQEPQRRPAPPVAKGSLPVDPIPPPGLILDPTAFAETLTAHGTQQCMAQGYLPGIKDGDKRILMLKNHGPVVMGKTLTDAFIKYWALQRACEIQLATMSMGKPILVSDDVIKVHQRDLYMAAIPGQSGKAEFDAMVRKVDKIDTSWRD